MNTTADKTKKWLVALASVAAAATVLVMCQQENAEEEQRKRIDTAIKEKGYDEFEGIYFKRLRHPFCDTAYEVCVSDTFITKIDTIRDDLAVFVRYDTIRGDSIRCDSIWCDSCTSVEIGTRLGYRYSARLFNGTLFRGAVFATTDSVEAARNGLVMQKPDTIRIGSNRRIDGLEKALMQTLIGDSVHIIFPFTLGYGDENYVGTVPPGTAQEWILTIIYKR